MSVLYTLLVSLLMGALVLLFWPFHPPFRPKIIMAGVAFILCFSLYFFISPTPSIRYWLTAGKDHYELLQEYQALGGVEGMIMKIKEKLAKNPNDQKGWIILGKLYLAQHNEKAAKEAFMHAGL